MSNKNLARTMSLDLLSCPKYLISYDPHTEFGINLKVFFNTLIQELATDA